MQMLTIWTEDCRERHVKKEVAAAKGITPETLSRHVHGKIQMTLGRGNTARSGGAVGTSVTNPIKVLTLGSG